MVWESKDIENFYEPDNPWTDEYFRFCNVNEKLVSLNNFMYRKIYTFWIEMIILLKMQYWFSFIFLLKVN